MTAVDEVLNAFGQGGWKVAAREQLSEGRSQNPTRADLVRRRQPLRLVVYAWKVTGEGKGRSGTNYRIQTTRSHEGPLITEPGRLTLGFGIDAERDVVVVFDGWTKRNTGNSSSVHIKRGLLDEAQSRGIAVEGPAWDERAASRMSEIERLLPWIEDQTKRRAATVPAVDFNWVGDTATLMADLWDQTPAAWIREGDQIIVADRSGKKLADNSIWTVRKLDVRVTVEGRYPRRAVTFELQRHGRVNNEARALEATGWRTT